MPVNEVSRQAGGGYRTRKLRYVFLEVKFDFSKYITRFITHVL